MLPMWLGAFTSVATFFGLLSAGLAIALRDPIVNLFGWFYILWRRPFNPGDRITVRDHTGDVTDQRLFSFHAPRGGDRDGRLPVDRPASCWCPTAGSSWTRS